MFVFISRRRHEGAIKEFICFTAAELKIFSGIAINNVIQIFNFLMIDNTAKFRALPFGAFAGMQRLSSD